MRVSKPHGSPERNIHLHTLYQTVREASRRLGAPLSDADATVQSMPDASPAKWHLAHTTWFFERMILEQHLPGYRVFDPQFNFLFNSYYESIGARQPRPRRGMITRPALETVAAYRDHVDRAMASLMQDDLPSGAADLIELGCNHEQQHQELLLTDILHLFAQNPVRPAYRDPGPIAVGRDRQRPSRISAFRWRRGRGRTRRRGLRLRLRRAAPPRADRTFRARRPARHQCGMDGVHGRRRLSLAAALALSRMGDASGRRLDGAALLGRAGGRLLVDDAARRAARRSRRAGHPCELFRGGRVRDLGRPQAADRVRVGACRGRRAAAWEFRRFRAPAPRACAGRARGVASDPWRCLGVDAQRLCALSAISCRRKARSANTTASSCAGSSCCAAARARRR